MAKKPPGLRVVGGGNFTPPEDVEGMAIAKLASSGISLVDARLLGMSWHFGCRDRGLHAHRLGAAFSAPSLLPAEQCPRPLSAVPGASPFYRLRALRDPIPNRRLRQIPPRQQHGDLCLLPADNRLGCRAPGHQHRDHDNRGRAQGGQGLPRRVDRHRARRRQFLQGFQARQHGASARIAGASTGSFAACSSSTTAT